MYSLHNPPFASTSPTSIKVTSPTNKATPPPPRPPKRLLKVLPPLHNASLLQHSRLTANASAQKAHSLTLKISHHAPVPTPTNIPPTMAAFLVSSRTTSTNLAFNAFFAQVDPTTQPHSSVRKSNVMAISSGTPKMLSASALKVPPTPSTLYVPAALLLKSTICNWKNVLIVAKLWHIVRSC